MLSDEDFRLLRLLTDQLHVCAEGKAHIGCILAANGVAPDCKQIVELLSKCHAKCGNNPDHEFSYVVTDLVNACELAFCTHVNDNERLQECIQWLVVLKLLDNSFHEHKLMWLNAKAPKEARNNIEEMIYFSEESDRILEGIANMSQLEGLFDLTPVDGLYSKLLKDLVQGMYSLGHEFARNSVKSAIHYRPLSFEFNTSFFEELFELEQYAMDQYKKANSEDYLHSFYTLLFFGYEHAATPYEICNMYAGLNRQADEFLSKRMNAARDSYNAFCVKFFREMFTSGITEEAALYFHWLYVMWPNAGLVNDYLDCFSALPEISQPN